MPKCNLAIKKYTRRGQTKYKFQVYLSFLVCSQWSRPFYFASRRRYKPRTALLLPPVGSSLACIPAVHR